MSYEELSENMTDVAEPSDEVTEESENMADVADQSEEVSEDTTQESEDSAEAERNHAFAEMRRAKEQAERELAEYRAQKEQEQAEQDLEERKRLQFAEVERYGREQGLTDEDIDDVKAEIEEDLMREQEMNTQKERIEELEQMNAELQAEKMAQADLEAIQKLDRNIKSLDELPKQFFDMRLARDDDGEPVMDAKQAYIAWRAISKAEEKEKAKSTPVAPDEPGMYDFSASGNKGYYTKAQVEAMSEAEISEHWDAIQESMPRW